MQHLPPHQHLPLYPASAIPSRSVRLLPRLYFPFPRDFSLPSVASPSLPTSCSHSPALLSASHRCSSFNVAMQDRYGLLTNPRSPKTLVTPSDFASLIAFRLRLRDDSRWIIDRWINLLRPLLNFPPGPPISRSYVTSSTAPVLACPPGPQLFRRSSWSGSPALQRPSQPHLPTCPAPCFQPQLA